jgi:putative ABC transport system substrate-binding protein
MLMHMRPKAVVPVYETAEGRSTHGMSRLGRRQFLIATAAFAAFRNARAQQSAKVFRIGFLSPAGRPGPAITALLQGLRELGYVEGRNLVIDVRYAEEKLERLPGLAAQLVQLKVDVLVPLGPPATRAAKQATNVIPIVLVGNVDPVSSGLVASLARPGGNITGMSSLADEAASKRLEMLKQIVPGLSRVGVFWDPGEPEEIAEWQALQRAARPLRLELVPFEVPAFGQVENVFAARDRAGVDALLNIGFLGPPRYRGRPILELAAKHRLPTVFGWPGLVQAGGLLSYNADFDEVFRRAATHIHRILNGAKPADLPIEQPSKFELVINRKAAASLGLAIPPSLLLRADRVIE